MHNEVRKKSKDLPHFFFKNIFRKNAMKKIFLTKYKQYKLVC